MTTLTNKEVTAEKIIFTQKNGWKKEVYIKHSQDGTTRVYMNMGGIGGSDDVDIFIDGNFVGDADTDAEFFKNYAGGKQAFYETIENAIIKSVDGNGGINKNWTSPAWLTEAAKLKAATLANLGTSTDLKDYGAFDFFLGATGNATGADAKSAQYPIDALYYTGGSDNLAAGGRTGKPEEEAQDHLVISQYKYKVPRLDDLFNNKSNNLLVKGIERNSALEKFLGLVRLPMPNDITDSNNVKWGEDVMNAIEAAGIATFGEVSGSEASALAAGKIAEKWVGEGAGAGTALGMIIGQNSKGAGLQNIMNTYGSEITSRILSMAGIEASAASILARGKGVIPNSNLELLFQAPMLREFQFNYRMSPRSEDEARVVNHIVRFFKQGMAAKKITPSSGKTVSASYFLGTPNVFRLQYRTANNEAPEGVNRMKTCALTGTSVNYTPEGTWAAYEGGQPVSIMLSMRFQELEPLYDTDYATWNPFKESGGPVSFDSSNIRTEDGDDINSRWSIRSTEVGY